MFKGTTYNQVLKSRSVNTHLKYSTIKLKHTMLMGDAGTHARLMRVHANSYTRLTPAGGEWDIDNLSDA